MLDRQFSPEEADLAVVGAWIVAQRLFAEDLAKEETRRAGFADLVPGSKPSGRLHSFREKRGVELGYM